MPVPIVLVKFELVTSQLSLSSRTKSSHTKEEHQRPCVTARFPVESIVQARESPHKWALDKEGTVRYIGDGRLFDIDSETSGKTYRSFAGYQQCLANKHVVLIGDSRVRYQYMALADYLTTGQWLRCLDYNDIDKSFGDNGTSSTVGSNSSCFLIDHEYSTSLTWNDWYTQSAAWINDECDCHREPRFAPGTTFENRFFRTITPFGPIKITYLQNFEDSVKFHAEFPPFAPLDAGNSTNNTRCQPGYCSHPPILQLSTSETLLEIVPKLQVTHVFANTGWKYQDGAAPQTLGCVLQKFRIENPTIAAFAVTHPWEQGAAMTQVPQHGCDAAIFDRLTATVGVPKSWYWDRIHSLSIVNQELNHMLLDMVCGPTQEC